MTGITTHLPAGLDACVVGQPFEPTTLFIRDPLVGATLVELIAMGASPHGADPASECAIKFSIGTGLRCRSNSPLSSSVLDLAVRSGAYQNPDEVIDQAFAIIREQLDLEDWMLGQREAIATHIGAGFAQAERGELIDGDEALAVLRQRRAERLKPQG